MDNNIYLDVSLLNDLMRGAADRLKTDGDYAAIVVAAHEFGHAVQNQLGVLPQTSFLREQQADCFAGAVTREAAIAGALDSGDLEEARFAMNAAGDDHSRLIFSQLYVNLTNLDRDAHGLSDQRQAAFDQGFSGGIRSCLATLGK